MKVLLLSHNINTDTPLYGDRGSVKLLHEKQMQNKDSSNVLSININTHTSTHVDVPYHISNEGKKLTDYASDSWLFRFPYIKKISVEPDGTVDEEQFSDLEYNSTIDLLIIKTGFEKLRADKSYTSNSPVVVARLADFLKKRLPDLRAVGFDFISISSLKNRQEGRKAHREFLARDIRIIEDMRLAGLKEVPDFVLASPLFIKDADGSPISVWAFYNDFDFNRYDYLFFDFDGVILDSVDVKTEAFRVMYAEYGKAVSDRVVIHHLRNGGMSRYDKFKYYHKEFLNITLSKRKLEQLAVAFSKIVFTKVLEAEYLPGVIEFLELCRKSGKTCFVVSATPEKEIKQIIKEKGLNLYFSQVRGSPRAKSENLKDLMRRYKVERTRSVFFGDSINDRISARENNIKFIGINYRKAVISYQGFEILCKKGGV